MQSLQKQRNIRLLASKAARGGVVTKTKQHVPSLKKIAKPFLPKHNRSLTVEAELELLTSYASDTVYRLRFDTMRYDYVSPAIEKLLGFTPNELEQLNFRSLIVETKLLTDGRTVVNSFDELEKLRVDGDVSKWQADYLMRTKDGRKVWVSDVSYPWFDKAGKIIGSVGSLRDITDRVEVESQLEEKAVNSDERDALTELMTKQAFFKEVDKELTRINRTDSDVSMMIFELDQFADITDQYGQDIGDVALVALSKLLSHTLRVTDLPARLGGNEFGVLLPDTAIDGASRVAERFRGSVLQYPFETGSDKAPLSVSVSVGVASASMLHSMDASELYKHADTQRYIAKNSGSNQVASEMANCLH